MDVTALVEIASGIGSPLALAGLVVAFLFLILRQVLSLEIFVSVSKASTERLVLKTINSILIVAILCVVLGFIGFISPVVLPLFYKIDRTDLSYAQRVHFLRTALAAHQHYVDEISLYKPDVTSTIFTLTNEVSSTGHGISPIVVTKDYPGNHCEETIFNSLILSDFLSEFYYSPVGLYIGHINFPRSIGSRRAYRQDFLTRWVPSDQTRLDILDEDEFLVFVRGIRGFYRYDEEDRRFHHSSLTYVFSPLGHVLSFVRLSDDLTVKKTLERFAGETLANSLRVTPGSIERELLYPSLSALHEPTDTRVTPANFTMTKTIAQTIGDTRVLRVTQEPDIGFMGLGAVDGAGAFEHLMSAVVAAIPEDPALYYELKFSNTNGEKTSCV